MFISPDVIFDRVKYSFIVATNSFALLSILIAISVIFSFTGISDTSLFSNSLYPFRTVRGVLKSCEILVSTCIIACMECS